MISLVLCLAALVSSPAETELEAKLPEIFAQSAAHYKALDAAATPLMKDGEGNMRTPHGWNKWKTGKDELDMRSIYWWTAGHFPGSLWYLYEATGDTFFKDRATVWTDLLAPNSKVTSNHDIGFVMYCSYGNARRILKTDKYDELLRETANSLCERYNEKLGLIRSWGAKDETQNFLVIPDNLMNLELLEFAAGFEPATPTNRFARIAERHADATMKHHFRPDGGCFHVLDYDQETLRVKEIRRGQGASCETAWSRGQSWAIYGYTMMYRTSGFVRYLDFAKKLADYAINHPNMPEDGIPYWDYGAPGEERDSSAGSIMASGLLELSQYVGAAARARYRAFAVKQLLSLASDAYFSKGGEIGHFLLKHGVGNKPGQGEIDTPLDYGDYYFLEALLRFRNLKAREKEVAEFPGIDTLPEKAQLPADELYFRSRSQNLDSKRGMRRTSHQECITRAEKILAEPIPETTDELYGEYWVTGDRSNYQKPFFERIKMMDALVLGEVSEGKGRFLPRVEEYLAAICAMKSWVLPAHDWSCDGKGTFRGEWISTDLFSTEVGAHLACVVQLLGPQLRPATVARIKAEVERRVFAPVRRELPLLLYPETAIEGVRVKYEGWFNGDNNWNAVCWDNLLCAAMGLIDDKADRQQFVASADKGANRYLELGFEADGYCSEGRGYWNYGYGHHLLSGRMLDKLTHGKINYFHRPKQRLAAAYARAYTLREGVSPAFADGGGNIEEMLVWLVDQYWPDLPKELPPYSEFPIGQVWLFRDPEGLSVAFKGGSNDEHHNHNDVGSYYLLDGDRFVAGDPGAEIYTRRTFSDEYRYQSKIINSYGHPVPVVGGKLQSLGRNAAAKVIEKSLENGKVVLDLTAAYDVKTLKRLTRTFLYDRTAGTFTVKDCVTFTEPTAFEDCYVTFGEPVKVEVTATGGAHAKVIARDVEKIDNPGKPTPHRFAWRFDRPVMSGEVVFTYHSLRK